LKNRDVFASEAFLVPENEERFLVGLPLDSSDVNLL
jgi:hypothetical protein